jgi:hypothetical protein
MDYNIKMQIRHLCGYITDKSTVLNYINSENGLRLTIRDIENALADDKRRKPADLKPMMRIRAEVMTHWHGRCSNITLTVQLAQSMSFGCPGCFHARKIKPPNTYGDGGCCAENNAATRMRQRRNAYYDTFPAYP